MIRLSRKMEYALVALKYMAGKIPGELTSAKEISDKFRTPFDVTARVMQTLTQKGLLKSEHGPQGGYAIAKDLNRVSFNDLLEIIEGPTRIVKCLQKDEACDVQAHCNIVSPVQTLNQKLILFYSGLKLKDLVVGGNPVSSSPFSEISEAIYGQ
ncbi:MAG: Rrf2 family transcriptional regulator [Bdellovibrionaceae bacterium]|nr:Rrf2 family transcriptional regulator [Pseudobdellovibrionaceae bacterium]